MIGIQVFVDKVSISSFVSPNFIYPSIMAIDTGIQLCFLIIFEIFFNTSIFLGYEKLFSIKEVSIPTTDI